MAALLSLTLPSSLPSCSQSNGLSSTKFTSKANATSLNSLFGSKYALRTFKVLRASGEVDINPASAEGDSVVPEVAGLPEEGDTEGVATGRPSALQKGGTLGGAKAAGKDAGASALGKTPSFSIVDGKFADPRWIKGTWDFSQFTKDGKVDWDAVIDAEVIRRKWLEENPESSNNDDPVVFETSEIPTWAWIKRFHLPEAEKLNGRAAMVGFALGYVVDAATGVGLVDQMSGFLGKLLLLISVVGILLIRRNEDLTNLRGLVDEWTFYDRQWQAAWKEGPPPAKSEKKD